MSDLVSPFDRVARAPPDGGGSLARHNHVRRGLAAPEASALAARGRELSGRGDVAAAIGCFRRAVGVDPDFADARIDLGAALYEQGDVAEAALELATALALRSGDVRALAILSMVLRRTGAATGG